MRAMLPAMISQMVVLLKETSLGFIVGYTEFLRNARSAVKYLGNSYSLPVYTLMAVVYISINAALSRLEICDQRRGEFHTGDTSVKVRVRIAATALCLAVAFAGMGQSDFAFLPILRQPSPRTAHRPG